MSLRQSIIQAVFVAIKEIRDPKPILVTTEPFEADKLAITQFPAVLISFIDEERTSVTMGMSGVGRRTGTIQLEVRGFIRGTELDKRRNDLLNAVENALDEDRYLGLRDQGVLDSQVIMIENIPRLAPLAEIRIVFRVNYNYLRGEQ